MGSMINDDYPQRPLIMSQPAPPHLFYSQIADNSSADNDKSPPASYVVSCIADILICEGELMFGRKHDADCLLIVGRHHYYVHMYLLACRSLTLRRIFVDMLVNGAWEDIATPHHRYLVDGGYFHIPEDLLVTMMSRTEEDHPLLEQERRSQDQVPWSPIVRKDALGHDQHFSSEDDDEDDDDDDIRKNHLTEQLLPRLTLGLTDPDGDHVKALLHWIYTNNTKSWLTSFTPENYLSILENIVHLHIASQDVLKICEKFEETTNTSLGLRGAAMSTLEPYLVM
ncbi:hypothetical protein BGZ83_000335 [Gryganskiella cystojenkinii]|nr:hypothetical protein BGZ83_000335 [Gryganskiella cystojenkinii]